MAPSFASCISFAASGFAGGEVKRARFRRGRDRARRRRCRHPRRARLRSRGSSCPTLTLQTLPRHRQRAFQDRAARRLPAPARHRQRHRRMAVRLSRPDFRDHQRRRPLHRDLARGARAERSGRTWPSSSARKATCRHGTSSRSAAPPSPRCPKRMPSGRTAETRSPISFSPATGRRPDFRQRSKGPFARARRPRI